MNEITHNSSLHRRGRSVIISVMLHLAVAGLLYSLIAERSLPQKVNFEVLEAPVAAPKLISTSPSKPKATAIKAKRAVFGLSRNAITDNSTSNLISQKTGNTLAKPKDNLVLTPEDPNSLPTITEDYLVSRMPELVSQVRVPYPPEAKRRGIEGAVIVDLVIDTKGDVRSVQCIEGPGAGLNEAALVATKQMKFSPALVGDKPVAVKIRYSYRFVLEH